MWYAECLKNCYNAVDRAFYDAIKIIPLTKHQAANARCRALNYVALRGFIFSNSQDTR